MSLYEFMSLGRKYWKVIAASSCVACFAFVMVALLFLPARYEAQSRITAMNYSGDTRIADLAVLVESKAEQIVVESGLDSKQAVVELGINNDANKVFVTVRLEDEGESISLANSIAQDASSSALSEIEKLREQFEEGRSTEEMIEALSGANDAWSIDLLSGLVRSETFLNYCGFDVQDATTAKNISPGPVKLGLLGLCFGFAASLAVIVLRDKITSPIRYETVQRNNVETWTYCCDGRLANYERLYALLTIGSSARVFGFVPLRDGYLDRLVGGLKEARSHIDVSLDDPNGRKTPSSDEGFDDVVFCQGPPISDGPEALYLAERCDVMVLCAREWSDANRELRDALEAFDHLGFPVAGIIVIQ